jgi:hypothetical protein
MDQGSTCKSLQLLFVGLNRQDERVARIAMKSTRVRSSPDSSQPIACRKAFIDRKLSDDPFPTSRKVLTNFVSQYRHLHHQEPLEISHGFPPLEVE